MENIAEVILSPRGGYLNGLITDESAVKDNQPYLIDKIIQYKGEKYALFFTLELLLKTKKKGCLGSLMFLMKCSCGYHSK